MARIAYDRADAGAFEDTRHQTDDGAAGWRAALRRHGRPGPGIAGSTWVRAPAAGRGSSPAGSRASTWWRVEPSAAMRGRCAHRPLLAGDAGAIPLRAIDVLDLVVLR